jgi:hypothetical protein
MVLPQWLYWVLTALKFVVTALESLHIAGGGTAVADAATVLNGGKKP